MLRWLTRLFRQREAAEAAPAVAPPPPAPPLATDEATASDAVIPDEIIAIEPTAPATDADAAGVAEPEKETCPNCGRTSVFAGPPGQRFCNYCALRDELFEASAAASE